MLSFGSASMLWWSLAAVIPFALHLWNRRPRQVVPFAAARFLVAATKRQSRRIKFQQWILLLLRVAMLLLFAMALAEPRWGASSTTIQNGAATHHLLLIDDSYSMDAKVDSERRLDLAKARLKVVVQTAPAGDVFSLVAIGDPAEIVIAGPSHDRTEVLEAIDAVEVRQAQAKLGPALSVVRRLIEDGKSLSQTPRLHHVTIASDLARNSWREANTQQIDADLTNAAAGCTWSLIAVGDTLPRNNLAITDFSCSAEADSSANSFAGEITVANTGADDVESTMLEIHADEKTLFRKEISLAAGQQRSFRWNIGAQRGIMLLTTRVDADDLSVDDRRYLVVETRAAPRVLCLASSEEAARHVMMAITSGTTENRPRVDVRVISAAEEKAPERIAEYNAILLLNLPPLKEEIAKALGAYVENGGGLLVGLGDRAAPGKSDLYPADAGPMIKLQSPRIDPLHYEHPLMEAFRDAPEVGLLSPPIWRYQRLEQLNPLAIVAAKFGNGDAALVEEVRGRGRIVLFAGSLGAESVDTSENPPVPWSGLPGSAAYVPLIREWIKRCATPAPVAPHMVGDLAANALGAGEQTTTEYSSAGEGWKETLSVLDAFPRAGFYRAAGKSPVAVNIDANESWFASERDRFAGSIDARAPESPQSVGGVPRKNQSLSVWLLFPLVLLICGELLLATWMRGVKSSPMAIRSRLA